MGEEQKAGEQGEQQDAEQKFAIQRLYIKDLSFETPNAPAAFTEKWDPRLNVEINSQANQLNEGMFEVVLKVTVTAKLDEKVAYLIEVQQAGIFELGGFAEEQLGQMIHSFCPNILFPYARETVSDIINRGSFPQLNLAPVNFDAIYAEHLQKSADTPEVSIH